MTGEALTGPAVLKLQSNSRWSGSLSSLRPRNAASPRNMGQSLAPPIEGRINETLAKRMSGILCRNCCPKRNVTFKADSAEYLLKNSRWQQYYLYVLFINGH